MTLAEQVKASKSLRLYHWITTKHRAIFIEGQKKSFATAILMMVWPVLSGTASEELGYSFLIVFGIHFLIITFGATAHIAAGQTIERLSKIYGRHNVVQAINKIFE